VNLRCIVVKKISLHVTHDQEKKNTVEIAANPNVIPGTFFVKALISNNFKL
jgi:hypothetical protein